MSKNNVSNISPFVLQHIIFGVTTGGPVQSWSHYVERLYKKAQGISGDILPWQQETTGRQRMQWLRQHRLQRIGSRKFTTHKKHTRQHRVY